MIRKALTLLAPNGLLITANVIQYGRLTREGAGTTFKVSIDRLVPSRIVLFERFLHSSFKFETKKICYKISSISFCSSYRVAFD